MDDKIYVKKETLDSLIFFYFGFTLDEDFDYILDRIVEKAYVDATNQGAFNTKAESSKAQLAKYGKDGSKEFLINQIKKILNENDIQFNDWHEETCDELVNIYENNELKDIFTYGNAQKWVNMTLKYIYLLGGISENYAEKFAQSVSKIRGYSADFHIPIDSYIIDVLWKKENVPLPFKDGIEKVRSNNYAIPSEYIKGWSNWHKDEYISVVKELRKIQDNDPIKWETENWIKRAKERKR